LETDSLAVVSETDILGDRLARPRRRRRASNLLAEGGILKRDMHSGQQYVPLLEIQLA
jgi:hypothetical protein